MLRFASVNKSPPSLVYICTFYSYTIFDTPLPGADNSEKLPANCTQYYNISYPFQVLIVPLFRLDCSQGTRPVVSIGLNAGRSRKAGRMRIEYVSLSTMIA